MNEITHHLRVLGLQPGASPDEVRQAWRDLVQVWHPDRFPGNERLRRKAEEQLKHINDAYERLRGLDAGDLRQPRPSGSAAPPGGDPPWVREYPMPEQQDPAEILRQGVVAWNLWRKKYSNLQPKLEAAYLARRDLSGIDFREVILNGANLREADLYKANLSGALLIRARLSSADLNRAILKGTCLEGADLAGANLSSADLAAADLTQANLQGANLIGADLSGANLEGASGLLRRQLLNAIIDSGTRLPRLADDYPGASGR